MSELVATPPSAADLARARERLVRVLSAYAGPLERLAASYARTHDERADLLQDIALALHVALPGFRGDSSEKTFVLRVAHNRAVTFSSKRSARPPMLDIDDHADDAAATTGANPAVRYERTEGEHRLLAAVRALPVPHRQVITLLLEGLSQRDVAEVLGTTEPNVAVRASRARAALRVLMEA